MRQVLQIILSSSLLFSDLAAECVCKNCQCLISKDCGCYEGQCCQCQDKRQECCKPPSTKI